MIFAILYIYNFLLVIDTAVQNNDNEIPLHFKPMGLILYELHCLASSNSLIYL